MVVLYINNPLAGLTIAFIWAADSRGGNKPLLVDVISSNALAFGALVPIPVFPELVILAFSVLFVLKTKSLLSIVPKKLLVGLVPLFPSWSQACDAIESEIIVVLIQLIIF